MCWLRAGEKREFYKQSSGSTRWAVPRFPPTPQTLEHCLWGGENPWRPAWVITRHDHFEQCQEGNPPPHENIVEALNNVCGYCWVFIIYLHTSSYYGFFLIKFTFMWVCKHVPVKARRGGRIPKDLGYHGGEPPDVGAGNQLSSSRRTCALFFGLLVCFVLLFWVGSAFFFFLSFEVRSH